MFDDEFRDFCVAFRVLPGIIRFSALTAILCHVTIM
jgi:nucleoside permease NupC